MAFYLFNERAWKSLEAYYLSLIYKVQFCNVYKYYYYFY